MRVVIRADAGRNIGLGHAMRCQTLAQALESAGARVEWAARPDPALTRVIGREPELALEGEPSFEPLPEREALLVGRFARQAEWVIVDHYGVDAEWLQQLRVASQSKLLLLDDHQHRQGADLRLAPLQEPAAGTLAGSDYILLRSPFDRGPWTATTNRRGWIVCFGGTDPERMAQRAVRQLLKRRKTAELAPLRVLSSDPEIDSLLADWPGPTSRLSWLDAEGLALVFASCEAALVSTSGVAFEALAMGTPIVGLTWSTNQERHREILTRHQIPVVLQAEQAADLLAMGKARHATIASGDGALRVVRAMAEVAERCPVG